MPSGNSATTIVLQLNKLSRDLTWLTKTEHYAEIKKLGHFDSMEICDCQVWAGIGPEMAEHIWADMLNESRETIRQAVVAAAENGLPLRWEIGGNLDHAKVVVARVLGGTVTLFLPARDAVAAGSARKG